MRLTVQVTLDGRIILLQGRNVIELPATDDTRNAIDLIQDALTVQAQVNGDTPQEATHDLPRTHRQDA